VARHENQPVWVIEVQRELAFAISFQLVQAAGDIPQIFQARRGIQRIEPHANQLGSTAALRAYQGGVPVAFASRISAP
jgi:hypothetical protein